MRFNNADNMRTQLKHMTMALIAAAAITGCKKDKEDPLTPDPPTNEEEVITTLELHFHSIGGSEQKHFTFSDTDGDGGNAPVITADTLSHDSIYLVEIEVLNESANPVVDITEEILEENTVHQFFFQVNGANAMVAYNDLDANALPIGLNTTWTMGSVSNGQVIVTLRHEPDKTAPGVSSGDITNAGGDTDMEVAFPLVIE